jgi:NOL1/NOP2/fmu family ribosome biogenesis protein
MLSMHTDVGKGSYCLLFDGARIGGGKLVGGRLDRED